MGVVAGVRDATRIRSAWIVPGRWPAAMTRLDLFSTLTALAPYAVVAVAAALAGFVLQNDLHRVQEDGVLVIGDPFAVSLYGGVLLLSVYLAASAAMAVAREREQGTVELLSYGPVSAFSYLLAKFTSHVLQCMFLVVLLLGSYLLLAVATGLHLRGTTLLAMALSIGPAAAAAALGLLVAALIRRGGAGASSGRGGGGRGGGGAGGPGGPGRPPPPGVPPEPAPGGRGGGVARFS